MDSVITEANAVQDGYIALAAAILRRPVESVRECVAA